MDIKNSEGPDRYLRNKEKNNNTVYSCNNCKYVIEVLRHSEIYLQPCPCCEGTSYIEISPKQLNKSAELLK